MSVYEFDQCDGTIQKEPENKGEKAEAVELTIQHNNQAISEVREKKNDAEAPKWAE